MCAAEAGGVEAVVVDMAASRTRWVDTVVGDPSPSPIPIPIPILELAATAAVHICFRPYNRLSVSLL